MTTELLEKPEHRTSDNRTLENIPLTLIQKSTFNPRDLFAEDAMDTLVASIHKDGLQQLPTVRHTGHNYEIVTGERRVRAYEILEKQYPGQYSTIPVIIVTKNDEEATIAALIENIHRVDLNAIEKAKAFRRLNSMGLTQQQIATTAGIDQATVSGSIGLLRLPEFVIEAIRRGDLSASHGAALLQLDEFNEQQANIGKLAIDENWTVRTLRAAVEKVLEEVKPKAPEAPAAVATLAESAKGIEQHDIEKSEQPRERFRPESVPSSATKESVTATKSVVSEPPAAKETPNVAASSTPPAAVSTKITSGDDAVQPQATPVETTKPSEPVAGGITCIITGENADWLWEHMIDTPDAAINKLKELVDSPEFVMIPGITADAFESAQYNGEVAQTLTPAEQIVAAKCGFDPETAIGYMSALLVRRVLACIENGHNIAFTLLEPAEGNGE